ncbi:hypothetical protein B5F78_11965 [Bacteroides sp. An279]|nr:hypothetical protein B5F78_11965 [Bacteroides sp. An279]OUP26902.1 hypothetical protein B5F25_19800 [Bacteroides sp. An19]
MLGRPDDIVIFSGQRLEAGTLSFPLSPYKFAVKNKGSQTGYTGLRMRKRTAEKTNERQPEK